MPCCRGAATPAARNLDSFRSGHPVRQRCVATILSLKSSRAEHEPERKLLGHRRRVILQQFEEQRIKKQINKNRELVVADVAHYLDNFYNSTRRHSHVGGVSPEQFEATHKPLRKGLH